jgi:hypothetical protein
MRQTTIFHITWPRGLKIDIQNGHTIAVFYGKYPFDVYLSGYSTSSAVGGCHYQDQSKRGSKD